MVVTEKVIIKNARSSLPVLMGRSAGILKLADSFIMSENIEIAFETRSGV